MNTEINSKIATAVITIGADIVNCFPSHCVLVTLIL